MLNTDKIRGIMRAKYGSQIPKFLTPAGPLIPELQNPFMVGSAVATPGIPGKLENPIGELQLKEMELSRLAILNTTNNQKRLLRLARGLARGTHMVSNGEVVLDGKQLVKNVGNAVGGFVKDNATIVGLAATGLAGLAKNFSLKNPNLVGMGIDALGNMFDRGVTNNSGTLKIFGIGDTIANGLMMVNPVAGLIGKGVMTVAKGINNVFGKKSKNFSKDTKTVEEIGGSYGGSVADINEAASKANTKYGLFSSGSRKAANRLIDSADYLQDIMADIADDVRDQKAMINDLNYLGYNMDLMGGYDLRYMRAAKSGMKLLDKINFIKLKRSLNSFINLDTKLVEEFKEGGKILAEWEPIIEDLWEPVIDIFQKGGKTRTLEELIEYAKKENPRFIQRLSEDPRGIDFVDEEGKNVQGSHLLGYELDEEGNAIVFPSIQEMEDGNLKYLSLWDAFDRAIEKKNFLKMTPEEAKLFTESGEDELGNLFGYKKGWPEFFKKFKKGGTLKEELETPEIEETNQKNLIPEGALHKNKHHMEHTEGLTQKGIPVIDNDGEQLAEIELDEIIFTLEVTKKLEELYRDGSNEAAIEAGKLLVKEILFNTDDRTELISKCEKGGKL